MSCRMQQKSLCKGRVVGGRQGVAAHNLEVTGTPAGTDQQVTAQLLAETHCMHEPCKVFL